jgi:NitT/TauT family transport system substrate-binding protein
MNRREFLRGTTLGGTAALLGIAPAAVAAEPPPETTTLRIPQIHDVCSGTPLIAAEDLLKGEGFTDVRYVKRDSGSDTYAPVSSGECDFGIGAAPALLQRLDAGDALVVLTGTHVGCFELFGGERIRSMADFKGRRVAVTQLGSGRHVFAAVMAAHVGLDAKKDIEWVTTPAAESMRLFAEGKIDGFMAYPPEPQELRARKIGHVVVNAGTDRPWSQYFCCMTFGNREFVRRRPVATKRALRAILKAASLCAVEPDRATKVRAARGYADAGGYARQALTELPYTRWREYDPADSVRFHALRLHEAGFIKSSPQKILAEATEFRFAKELRKELKG